MLGDSNKVRGSDFSRCKERLSDHAFTLSLPTADHSDRQRQIPFSLAHRDQARSRMINTLKQHSLNVARKCTRTDTTSAVAALKWNLQNQWVLLMQHEDLNAPAEVCGTLFVDIYSDTAEEVDLSAELLLRITRQRCADAGCSVIDIGKWTSTSFPTTLVKGTHESPFHIRIPAKSPGTADTSDIKIQYRLTARLSATSSAKSGQKRCVTSCLTRPVTVKRLFAAANPPMYYHTKLSAIDAPFNAIFKNVIKPSSENQVTIHLENLLSFDQDIDRHRFWHLEKLKWSLEEITSSGTSTSRVIATETTCKDWRSDWWKDGGSIDIEFGYRILPQQQYCCDIAGVNGLEVKHALVVDMLFARKTASGARSSLLATAVDRRSVGVRLDVVLSSDGILAATDEQCPPMYEELDGR